MKRTRFLTLSALYLATHAALADDSTQKSSDQVTRASSISAETPTATQRADQLAAEFAGFVGSADSAAKLVDGLLSGSPISLAANPSNGNAAREDIRIVPPAHPLTLPDIYAALSLAQSQLRTKGIASPVPTEYLRASLVGGLLPNAAGDMTRVVGILPLRQRGMNWEQIARALRVAQPRPWSDATAGNGARES